jgi:hypothetical protein
VVKNAIPYYTPFQVVVFLLFLASVLVGYFLLEFFLTAALARTSDMQQLCSIAGVAGELALYSKLLLARVHPLYAATVFPPWFPSEALIKEKLEGYSSDLTVQLKGVFEEGTFQPGKLQDVDLLQLSVVRNDNTIPALYSVIDPYFMTHGLYDAIRMFAYNAYETGSSSPPPSRPTGLETVLWRIALPLANFPMVLMESVTRANLDYSWMVDKALVHSGVVIGVRHPLLLLGCIGANILIIVCAFAFENKKRNCAFLVLLPTPRTYVHNMYISLISSSWARVTVRSYRRQHPRPPRLCLCADFFSTA